MVKVSAILFTDLSAVDAQVDSIRLAKHFSEKGFPAKDGVIMHDDYSVAAVDIDADLELDELKDMLSSDGLDLKSEDLLVLTDDGQELGVSL